MQLDPQTGVSLFLSTLPARGATPIMYGLVDSSIFLSTLPARGATDMDDAKFIERLNFYPRSPRGERHPACRPRSRSAYFYPRSPRGERRPLPRQL